MFSRWRVQLKISGNMSYISHLDLLSALQRALRRAGLPMRYSEGFNPHMCISFGPAHAVGVAEDCLYCDIDFASEPPNAWQELLGDFSPAGLSLVQARKINDKSKSLMASINLAVYELIFEPQKEALKGALAEGVQRFLSADSFVIERVSPKGKKIIDIRPSVTSIELIGSWSLCVAIRLGVAGTPKPQELAQAIAPSFSLLVVRRTGLFIEDDQGRHLP
ncbi:MAG: TIGR03936 family radical SAM-associated protein [Bacillota bacterium]|jgi:radical SAM-linked protein